MLLSERQIGLLAVVLMQPVQLAAAQLTSGEALLLLVVPDAHQEYRLLVHLVLPDETSLQ